MARSGSPSYNLELASGSQDGSDLLLGKRFDIENKATQSSEGCYNSAGPMTPRLSKLHRKPSCRKGFSPCKYPVGFNEMLGRGCRHSRCMKPPLKRKRGKKGRRDGGGSK